MADADAVVVTQGTDTLEETSYLFDRWRAWPKPLVFTGAMRNPSLLSPDGPANLFMALEAAKAPELRDVGVVVAIGDEVHAATFVRKVWSQRVHAFASPEAGPVAWYAEGRFHRLFTPPDHPHFGPERLTARVPLVRLTLGMTPEDLPSGHVDAVVLEGMGGGHVPECLLPTIDAWLEGGVAVVVVPRPDLGPPLFDTYAFRGSERDLLQRGAVMGRGPGLKTRLRLWLALSKGRLSRAEVAEVAMAF